MNMILFVLVIALIVVGILALFWYRIHVRASSEAGREVKEIMLVWAALGPFESGVQSAAALRYANIAVLGAEEAERMAHSFASHAESFTADPDRWESARKTAVEGAHSTTERYVAVAKELQATDERKHQLFKDVFDNIFGSRQ